jgi:uncharacterized protein YceH (UPF0502 family)
MAEWPAGALAKKLSKLPGQKDARYMHLLSGEPVMDAESSAMPAQQSGGRVSQLEAEVAELKTEVADLRRRLEELESALR